MRTARAQDQINNNGLGQHGDAPTQRGRPAACASRARRLAAASRISGPCAGTGRPASGLASASATISSVSARKAAGSAPGAGSTISDRIRPCAARNSSKAARQAGEIGPGAGRGRGHREIAALDRAVGPGEPAAGKHRIGQVLRRRIARHAHVEPCARMAATGMSATRRVSPSSESAQAAVAASASRAQFRRRAAQPQSSRRRRRTRREIRGPRAHWSAPRSPRRPPCSPPCSASRRSPWSTAPHRRCRPSSRPAAACTAPDPSGCETRGGRGRWSRRRSVAHGCHSKWHFTQMLSLGWLSL